MNMRLSAAILAGKAAFWVSRLRGNRGSSLPGMVARKIYPGCLTNLASQVHSEIIIITGTNGKTTTTNMICEMLTFAGFKIVANLEGANMIPGVTTSFIMKSPVSGKIDCDYAILEVDEASVPRVVEEVSPGAVVITNFFRDQLDRYWEIDKVIGVIKDSLSRCPKTTLVLNADDPLVAQLAEKTGLPVIFFGLARCSTPSTTGSKTREARFCPFCGSALVYEFINYGQLGMYNCPGCQFARPDPKVAALEPGIVDGRARCRLVYNKQEFQLDIQTQGLYNLYNALAALAVGLYLGVGIESLLSSLREYQPVLGRMEKFMYRGREVFLSLVKNPAGFNEGLAALCSAKGTKDVFIAINDNDQDGRDISWLWDVDFEILGSHLGSIPRFVCSGRRGEEMAMRLKYAGMPSDRIFVNPNLSLAIKNLFSGGAGKFYIFSTYTVLWPVHKIVEKQTDKEGAGDQHMPSVS